MKEEQRFHSYYDANYGTLANHNRSKSGIDQAFSNSSEFSYRFYPHFHPYVAELIERLIKKSVPGLQAADTEYYPSLGHSAAILGNRDPLSSNKDGTLEVLPGSTLVALDKETVPEGSNLPVPQGTQIFLPDGTWVKLPDGRIFPIPGTMTRTQPPVMVFYFATLRIPIKANEGKLTLISSQQVRLPQGQLVTLPADTELVFLGCKPQPKLYDEIFLSPDINLVACWKFDDGQGTWATDSSLYGNNAKLNKGTFWTTQGRINGAIIFDVEREEGGEGEEGEVGEPREPLYGYAEVPNSEILEQIGKEGKDFSVAFWIYLRQGPTGKFRSIMHKGSDDRERTFALWMHPTDNRIHYVISTDRTEFVWGELGYSNRQIALKTWTHICYVKTRDRLKLYINGILDGYVPLQGKSVGNKGPLYIGKDPWYPGFIGNLDELHIYSGALSEKEIGALARGFSLGLTLEHSYNYTPSHLVERPYPAKELDFSPSGAYSVYNWELFYHVPITLAIHLSKNQRFEEAQQWFHYIFDPTGSGGGGDHDNSIDLPTPERFWKVKAFQYTDVKLIEEILKNFSLGTDPKLKAETMNSIEAWKNAPFRPHVVARYRQTAYMFKTVMAYLDNLIDWGDSLFRQDTGESINEATQLYVLAANILGPRPQAVPQKKLSVRPKTYASLRADSDNYNKVLRDLEADIPFDLAPHPNNNNIKATDMENGFTALSTLSNTALYFCVPHNDKLLSYWDTVADRLFKIHNSLNIQGIFRQLPLFEPPIDPALLAKAAAAGLDVGAIISGIDQPLPLVRFQLLVQKAAEICQEVKSLGNNLLSAIEKEDNEALALLRAKHERVILGLAETVKYGQLQEAIKAREGLEKSINNAIQRYTYYERLMGKQGSEIKLPQLDAFDTAALEKMMFKAGEPDVSTRPITVDIAQSGPGTVGRATAGILGASDITGGQKISSFERQELDKLESAQLAQDAGAASETLATFMNIIPTFSFNASPLGVGTGMSYGGSNLGAVYSGVAHIFRGIASRMTYEANSAAKVGSFARREQEWAFQSNLAAGEITQTFKQLRAAQIREAIADREWKNHQQQIRFAEEIERFLTDERTGKKTNQAFYAWMKREVKGLYTQCFQFAFDIAKKAERALQHELGNQELSFIQFNYLAGKEGLLAGEKLYLDIKRMEMAYHELNQREYELTKHVSLMQVSPEALLKLRTTGSCTVFLPEELFDMDCPGHYFRRIKSVAMSIPCVTGPYTGVNCTLTLRKSSIRKSALLRDGAYARDGLEDNRFSDHFGSMQSIVTSTAQNDSGLFETNLRDERYLPFEGSGVISEWQLELPDEVRQFDYDTISDIILHFRYTAREGGELLRGEAVKNLKNQIKEAQAAESVRLFSIRHEFPNEWAKFKKAEIKLPDKDNEPSVLAELTLNLREEHYPFWSKDIDGNINESIEIRQVELYAKPSNDTKPHPPIDIYDKPNPILKPVPPPPSNQPPAYKQDSLNSSSLFEDKMLTGRLDHIQLPTAAGRFSLYFKDKSIDDLWLALTWGKKK
jgi:Tc toxin complex TcA C-terminal TcB-binding domain/Concanavalin A-like lectin/glucanases superfamily